MRKGDRVTTPHGRTGVYQSLHLNPDFSWVLFDRNEGPGDLVTGVPRCTPTEQLTKYNSTLEDMLS